MTMTRRERSEMEELRNSLLLAKAMRFTPAVEPDVPIPETFTTVKGFLYNAYNLSSRVEPACTGATSHCFGRDDKTTTQQGRCLYSTRLLALRAMRNDAEQKCARWLADIDRQIEAELASSSTSTPE